MEKCSGTPPMEAQYGKMQIDPKYSFQQIDPKYSFQQIDPKYSFQQIEPTDKSSYVLNTQWHFFKKMPWGIVHYYSVVIDFSSKVYEKGLKEVRPKGLKEL